LLDQKIVPIVLWRYTGRCDAAGVFFTLEKNSSKYPDS